MQIELLVNEYIAVRYYLKVKRVHPDAKLPTKGTPYAAGFDFYTPERVEFPPKKTTVASLGVSVAIPHGTVLILSEKSGISSRTDLIIRSGIIDSDFRGALRVMYYNAGTDFVVFNAGDKIVQGVLLPIPEATVQEVDELDYTDRGENGFGSTGV